jgi:hypothetical protein
MELTRAMPIWVVAIRFLLEVSGGRTPLILALGKDRKAYVLDRNNLGGIGGQLAVETVSERQRDRLP